jgi:hypothetical protein
MSMPSGHAVTFSKAEEHSSLSRQKPLITTFKHTQKSFRNRVRAHKIFKIGPQIPEKPAFFGECDLLRLQILRARDRPLAITRSD